MPDGRVLVVGVDVHLLARLNAGEIRRHDLAAAIQRIRAHGAAGIVLAFPLHAPERPVPAAGLGPGDLALYEALLASANGEILLIVDPTVPATRRGPLDIFARAADTLDLEAGRMGAGATALARWAGERLGAAVTVVDSLNPYGPAGTMPTVPLDAVIGGDVGAGDLAGRIAVIGPLDRTAGAQLLPGPFGPLPATEWTATLIDNALSHRGLTDAGLLGAAVAAFAAGVALTAAALLPGAAAAGTVAGIGVAIVIGGQIAFTDANLEIQTATLMIAATAAVAAGLMARVCRAESARRQQARQVAHWEPFVPPVLAAVGPDAVAFAAGRRQVAAILFADLRGFTAVSERLSPEAVADLLRALYHASETAVSAHGGSVVGYLGDGVMAVFGLSAPRSDDPARALACARELTSAIGADPQISPHGLTVSVGVHLGAVVVAGLGGVRFRQLTATGDAVNVAHRLLEVAKSADALVAVSDDVVAAVHAEAGAPGLTSGLIAQGACRLPGRTAPLGVWLLPADAAPSNAAAAA